MALMPGNKGAPEDNLQGQLCNQLYRPSSITIEHQAIDEYEVRVSILVIFCLLIIVNHFLIVTFTRFANF